MTIEKEYYNDAGYGDDSTAAKHFKTEEIAKELPDYLPVSRGTGHYNLIYPVGDQVAQLEHDILDAAHAQQPQNAQTIEQLARLGELFDTPPNEGETKEHYRGRLLAEGQIATSEGTANDIIEGGAEILDTDSSNLVYSEPIAGGSENGTVSVELPQRALNNVSLTASEVAGFLDRLAPAGCRVEGLLRGTFTYITPTKYNNNNHDSTKGYDGLDANGDPKDNGGTYAGAV